MKNTRFPKAVILNCNNIMALPIIRQLGKKNISITAIFGNPNNYTPYHKILQRSKYINDKMYFDEMDYTSNLINILINFGKAQNIKPVIFLASDQDLISCSEQRIKLQDYFHLTLPLHTLIDKILSKEKFIDLALSHHLPIPKSIKIEYGADLNLAVKDFHYPFLVKPSWRNNEWLRKFKEQKLFIIKNDQDLIVVQNLIKNIKYKFLIQEIILGSENNIYCSFSILNKDSDPIGIGYCRKLSQYPKNFGNTSMAEPIEDRELKELSTQIFKELKLVGYNSIEFKRDPTDNKLKIIEITPNRFNRQFAVTSLVGLNLPYSLYNFELNSNQKIGLKKNSNSIWISEINEYRTLKDYIKEKDFSLIQYIKKLMKIRCFEIFDKKDLKPFVSFLFTIVKRIILSISK